MNDDGTATGRNGNVVRPRDGKFYDEQNKPMTKDNPKWKNGVVRRNFDDMFKRGDKDLGGELSPNPVKSTADISDNHQEDIKSKTRTDDPNNEVKHGKSFDGKNLNQMTLEKLPAINLNMDSLAETSESVKSKGSTASLKSLGD